MQSYVSTSLLQDYSKASKEYLHPPLSSRASSASLSFVRPLDLIDGLGNDTDVRIAQGLLAETSNPSRRQSPGPRLETFHSRSNLLGGSDGAAEERYDGVDSRRKRSRWSSSNTWTDSSGGVLSEVDDVEDRTEYVDEYNRLAKKHGVRLFVPEEYECINTDISAVSSRNSGSWIRRKILRRKSAQTLSLEPVKNVRHKRSISDFSIRLKKRCALKDKSLQDLVRLCGISLLYLPNDYAVGSLALPTCFRATAQYLVQHADSTKGIFRIPGSHSTINALYEHYASLDNETGAVVSGTVRCPTLPEHVPCDVYDVASAFKRFLSGLPGGILGSARLFDAFLGIQAQFRAEPELIRTKQTKVRARLIALAVFSVRSQYRRELICAVFGLLSWVGRKAETTPRENEHGRPLPTTGYMGYEALGVVFGPLLVGELLDFCEMGDSKANLRSPAPAEQPTSRKERQRKPKTVEEPQNMDHLERLRVVNSITAMLITHWRDVVRHLKNFGVTKIGMQRSHQVETHGHSSHLHPSSSTSFEVRKPPNWDETRSQKPLDRSVSPTPPSRGNKYSDNHPKSHGLDSSPSNEHLSVSKPRSRPRHMSSRQLSGARSLSILSPTREESAEEQMPSLPSDIGSSFANSRNSKEFPAQNQSNGNHPPESSYLDSSDQNTDLAHTTNHNLQSHGPQENEAGRETSGNSDPVIAEIRLLSLEEINDRYKRLPPPIMPSFMQRTPPGTKTKPSKDSTSREYYSKAYGNTKTPRSSKGSSGLMQRIKNASPALFASSSTQPTDRDTVRGKSPVRALHVPSGIVANRLRDLTASDPGAQPSDRLQTPLLLRPDRHVRRGNSPPDRNGDPDSATRSSALSIDPLKQISKEEDEASLAALASAIGSMDEDRKIHQTAESSSQQNDIFRGIPSLPSSKNNPERRPHAKEVNNTLEPTARSEASYNSPAKQVKNMDGATSGQSEFTRKESQRDISSTDTIVLGQKSTSEEEPSPSYMRATKSAVARRESVKDKIAKFNCVEKSLAVESSPTRTPRIKPRMRGSDRASRDSIVSGYTINPTSSPARSMKSNRSESSIKSYISAVRRTDGHNQPSLLSSLTPAPLRINRLEPRTPRRDSTKAESKNIFNTTPNSTGITPTLKRLSVSDLARTFSNGLDGNGSFTMQSPSRNGSPLRIGTILPHPTPPPVAQHIHSYRPSALPMEPGIECEASTLPTIESVTRKGSNSTLHNRIQILQKQLQARDEEVVQYKHQLKLQTVALKSGEGDIGTLSEQLRETRRECDMWKARAKSAERRLETLTETGTWPLDGNRSESMDSEAWAKEGTVKFFHGARRDRNEEMSEITDLSRAILNAIQGDASESDRALTPKKGETCFGIDRKENSRRKRTLTHTREGSEDYMAKEADLLLQSWDEGYAGPFELE